MENTTKNAAEEKITIGSDLGKKVNCSMCNKEGSADEFITMQNNNGETVYLCQECKIKTNEVFEKETKDPNMMLGLVAGIVGGIIGGLVWYYVALGTGKEIGYISLGLGYLVGMGVYLGSGKKRGHQLQIMSAVIALVSIIVTEKFLYEYFINDYIQAHLAEYPNMVGQVISVSFFDPNFWQGLASPIGLLIYVLGVYFAYKVCKPREI